MVAQITAVTLFFAMFVFIVLDKYERYIVTLSFAGLTLLLVFMASMRDPAGAWHVLNLHAFFDKSFWMVSGKGEPLPSMGINWSTILFIAGMMIMVEGMSHAGFFQWLCLKIAKLVKYKPMALLITFMGLSFVLSMFIDSITVILFLAAITIQLSQMLKFNPTPMILSEIFCANLGGSATMCGDPPNIIIGTSLGFSFFDFVKHTGVIALISFLFVILYYGLTFRKDYKGVTITEEEIAKFPDPRSVISSRKEFLISTAIFLFAVVLLISHGSTGFTVPLIGTIVAILTLATSGKNAKKIIKKLDYKTLLFFTGLFVVVSGLEASGVLELVAAWIKKVSHGSPATMIIVIIWVSAFASAFVDNIPFSATMIPVIRSLSISAGVPLPTLAWALSMGTDIGGSATPIGASANVVGLSVSARSGHAVTWKEYCKKMVPPTIIVLVISTAVIIVRYL